MTRMLIGKEGQEVEFIKQSDKKIYMGIVWRDLSPSNQTVVRYEKDKLILLENSSIIFRGQE